jgi:hypothetical protein
MLFNQSSDSIIEQIKNDAGVWQPRQLSALLEAGRKKRIPDFDTICKGIAQRYSGDQKAIVRDALKRSYPKTGEQMPVDPINWIRFFARQDSGVYSGGAKRYLIDDQKEPLDDDDPRAVSFGEALDQIGIDVLMPEVERRAQAGARSALVMCGFRQIGEIGKCVAHLYWPQDVVCLAHESAPDDVDALWFVAIAQSSEQVKDASKVWWCWTREIKQTDDGRLTGFGPWTHRRVSEDGKVATASEIYKGRFPGAFLRIESPDGGFWPMPDKDISVNVDNLNIARSNRQHVINMQAHSLRVYKGSLRETKELVGGPDTVIQIDQAESLDDVPSGADHVAIKESATRDLQELGTSRGNSPDAYSVEPGVAQSGISRIIANAPHDQRIEEMRPVFKRFEERQLLPIIVELLELFSPKAPASFNGVKPVVQISNTKQYEDDTSKTQRVIDLRTANLIDDADARVLLGLSEDREDALAYLKSIKGIEGGAPVAGQLFGSLITRETTQE